MERIESSETSALKVQTTGDYPENTIRHSTHGGSLKSRYLFVLSCIHKYVHLRGGIYVFEVFKLMILQFVGLFATYSLADRIKEVGSGKACVIAGEGTHQHSFLA